MIKILAITASLNDGASIPRVNSLMTIEGIDVRIKVDYSISDLNWADIVFIHRPVTPNLLALCQITKQLGKKLWIDNDDDQLNVPMDHPFYFFFNDEITKNSIRESNKLADVVTISNPNILKSYADLNKNIVYYPCAYHQDIYKEEISKERKKTVLWRGSNTHTKSLMEYAPYVIQVANKHPDWEFHFIGDNPWYIIEQIKNPWWVQREFLPPEKLWQYMKDIRPSIQMLCLTDNQFTRSRSNMAYMDGTLAGAITVAPDWDHWKCPSIENYSSHKGFVATMDNLMGDFNRGYDSSKDIAIAKEYILKNHTFEAINVKQKKIINKLTEV